MEQTSMLDQWTRGIRAYVLLFLLTFLTAAPGVFTMPALDRDESRFAQASKQMLETGDYIKIRYQDEERNKKPAGIHWLQSATTAIFSSKEAKQIWSYRLPSFIGGALAACALFWGGIPLIGRRAAFIGAALFGTGILLTSEAHISKTDGVLVAITTLGVAALIHMRAGTYRLKPLAILFWFAMGFGFLIKGPVTPMVAFLALVGAALWQRRGWQWMVGLSAGLILVFIDNYIDFGAADQIVGYTTKAMGVLVLVGVGLRFVLDERREDWFKALIWWPGPLLWVAMVLPWFLWIQLATDGDFFRGAVGKDLKDKVVGASEGHGGPPGYHLAHLLIHFFPATLFLIPGIALTIKGIVSKSRNASALIFLASWAIPTWIVFEFLPTKLSHYVLPAYPALALLCGYAVVQLMDRGRAPISRWASLVFFLLGGAALLIFTSPIASALLRADAASDFKTVNGGEVLVTWTEQTPEIWWSLIPGAVCLLGVFVCSIGRKVGLAIVFALLSSLTLGWHTRISFLPNQTWVQATTTAREALEDVCGLPSQTDCEAPSETGVQAIGFAEPSFVFTTGTGVKISPYSSTELLPASEEPVMVFLLNLEDRDVSDADIEDIRRQAEAQGRCVTQSAPHYAFNYSNGDPVHFIAVRVDQGGCAS